MVAFTVHTENIWIFSCCNFCSWRQNIAVYLSRSVSSTPSIPSTVLLHRFLNLIWSFLILCSTKIACTLSLQEKSTWKIFPVLDFLNRIYNNIHNSSGCFVYKPSSKTFILILWLRWKKTLNIVGLTPLIFRLQPPPTVTSKALLLSAPNFAVNGTLTLAAITAQRKSATKEQVTLA